MLNIKKTLCDITNRYHLEISGLSYENKIKQAIAEILNTIPNGKTVAIKGAGQHTQQLLSVPGCMLCPDYIFNKRSKTIEKCEIAGHSYQIYPDDEIKNIKIDVMIISSFAHRKEISEELKAYQGQFEILDIYDELQKHDLDVNAPFYQNAEATYENVLYYRKEYNKDDNADNLKNLIVAYLGICDFINFFHYSDEYIKKQYNAWNEIQQAQCEVTSLLEEVKSVIQAREQRDIITIWNDQVGYSELKYAPYMEQESKNSLFFENAYTMTPFTIPSFYEMFQGKKSIDDEIYHKINPAIGVSNSEIIQMLENNGYRFVYVGDDADARLFESDYVKENYAYSSTLARCVELLQVLIEEEKPVCCILHSLVETHNPYLSGELNHAKRYDWPQFLGDTEEKALEQMKKSLAYWDKQLHYFVQFFPNNAVKLYMSDHGKRFNIQPIYKEPTTHIVLFVVGSRIPVVRYSKMFSLYNYAKLLKAILDEQYDEALLCKDYVLMQETNIFNNTTLCYYIENGVEECGCAFRAVRTEKELFVKLSAGKRYYYLLPDEKTNHADDGEYKNRILELDELAGNKFDDPTEYEKELAYFRNRFETHE